ncbi:hypothetical protein HNP38_001152 [Chryseobacterium defluvii]|uniref:Insertion element IS150 protein InsJ-like helix-turn-helix domain-containing protein n=1 Tax=Chryseobacterium defluvii TaxID=160396 RepID=A0A840KEC1_9FLAO|nr:helix-turn-helix domain-containing protein [Chryseobacterium defluvii]MBB4805880.1 hypothetical protein [Chryseobacterium defluvii]
MTPDYKRIYSDIIKKKFPDKKEDCKILLAKENLSAMDIIKLNTKIFGALNRQSENINQRHNSYNKSDILQILDYQKKNRLNNSQLARHFKLSRTTVSRWRKIFQV